VSEGRQNNFCRAR